MAHVRINGTPLSARQERALHFRKWLRHTKRVASVTPSSRPLAEATCRHVDPDIPQVIVELGAGTGAVTRIAETLMHPESRIIAVEEDPEFARVLERTAPLAEVVVDDAGNLDRLLSERDVRHVDVVLNGLPTPSLKADVRDRVLDVIGGLDGQPWVSQITVMPWVYLQFYRRLFEDVRFEPVFRNCPPGGVYHCRRVRLH